MFNSNILDVAIGMIFVYLLLSLMCTAANEIIELMLKKRAIDLERGIRELLAPGSLSGKPDIVQKLYDHALINNLFGGEYGESKIKSRIPWLRWKRTQLPSYIPARSFALALMDLVGLPSSAITSPPAQASPPASTGWRLLARLRNSLGGGSAAPTPEPLPSKPTSGASFATAPSLAAKMAAQFAIAAAVGGEVTSPPSGPPIQSPPSGPLPVDDPFTKLRQAIIDYEPLHPTSKRALITLLDAAGGDVAKARENIEKWYDSSMDRVSGWYKRRAQLTILVIGLFVAIAVNVDTITVAKMLSTDKALRESLVNAADAYAKANASPAAAASPSETAAAPAGNASPSETAAAAGNASPGTAPTAGNAARSGKPAPAAAVPIPIPACEEDENSAECLRAKAVQEACKDPKSKKCMSAKSLEEACQDPASDQCQRAKDVQQACTDPNSAACQSAKVLEEACKDPDSTECQNAKALEEPCTDSDPAKCKELRLQKASGQSSKAGDREKALQEACATENSPACTSARKVYVACSGSDTVKCQRETALHEACAASLNSDECKIAKKLYQACEDPDSPQCQLAKACTDPNSVECQRAKALDKACAKGPNSPNCKYLSSEQQLRSLGLPIGWDTPDDPKRKWPGKNFFQTGGWVQQFYWHGLGWLLTALAISLGAPFWFDLLNKFIVIRAAVKPTEKSPEEKSKD
ncbi:MAG: hypothetical protein ACR2H6_02115 [Pyrinomonadaceae bacterium]